MRKGIVIAAAAVLLLLLACPQSGPTVSIVAPKNNDTLNKGTVTLKAHATDKTNVTKVEFYVDAVLTGAVTTAVADTFSYAWDASGEATGAHTLKATAYNTADKTASASINIVFTGSGPTVHTSDITADSTWYPSGNPHIIAADIGVYNNATLTIMPGCVVKFEPGYELDIADQSAGALKAIGKADTTILFTSNAASPAPGDWNQIGMYEYTMPTTQFAYCTFEYGGAANSDQGEIFVRGNTVVKLDNCKLRHSGDYGIVCQNNSSSFASLTNDTITTCAKYPIYIYPNNVKAIGAGNVLSGNATGYDGIQVAGATGSDGVTSSQTWLNLGVPYILNGDVEVDDAAGPVLTIAAGNTVKLASGHELYCGYTNPGGIIAIGTSSTPITFTSAVASPNRGDWSDIGLYELTGTTTQFAYCTFEYGGAASGEGSEVYVRGNTVVKLDHCNVSKSGNFGILCPNNGSSFASLTNNTITTCANYPIDINPNNVAVIGAGNVLSGNDAGYDGILVEDGTGSGGVTTSQIWLNLGVPYVLNGDVEVDAASGPALTIAAGNTIKVASGREFYCGYSDPGAILADGTSGEIIFTSILPSPAPGSWSDIGFYEYATNQSMLKHCRIEYAGSSNEYGDVFIRSTSLPVITADSIGYSANYGIYLNGSPLPDSLSLQNTNTFYNDASGDIYWP
jgi:hypothetical protein